MFYLTIATQLSKTLFSDLIQHIELKHYALIGYISHYANRLRQALDDLEKFDDLMIDREHLKGLCKSICTWVGI